MPTAREIEQQVFNLKGNFYPEDAINFLLKEEIDRETYEKHNVYQLAFGYLLHEDSHVAHAAFELYRKAYIMMDGKEQSREERKTPRVHENKVHPTTSTAPGSTRPNSSSSKSSSSSSCHREAEKPRVHENEVHPTTSATPGGLSVECTRPASANSERPEETEASDTPKSLEHDLMSPKVEKSPEIKISTASAVPSKEKLSGNRSSRSSSSALSRSGSPSSSSSRSRHSSSSEGPEETEASDTPRSLENVFMFPIAEESPEIEIPTPPVVPNRTRAAPAKKAQTLQQLHIESLKEAGYEFPNDLEEGEIEDSDEDEASTSNTHVDSCSEESDKDNEDDQEREAPKNNRSAMLEVQKIPDSPAISEEPQRRETQPEESEKKWKIPKKPTATQQTAPEKTPKTQTQNHNDEQANSLVQSQRNPRKRQSTSSVTEGPQPKAPKVSKQPSTSKVRHEAPLSKSTSSAPSSSRPLQLETPKQLSESSVPSKKTREYAPTLEKLKYKKSALKRSPKQGLLLSESSSDDEVSHGIEASSSSVPSSSGKNVSTSSKKPSNIRKKVEGEESLNNEEIHDVPRTLSPIVIQRNRKDHSKTAEKKSCEPKDNVSSVSAPSTSSAFNSRAPPISKQSSKPKRSRPTVPARPEIRNPELLGDEDEEINRIKTSAVKQRGFRTYLQTGSNSYASKDIIRRHMGAVGVTGNASGQFVPSSRASTSSSYVTEREKSADFNKRVAPSKQIEPSTEKEQKKPPTKPSSQTRKNANAKSDDVVGRILRQMDPPTIPPEASPPLPTPPPPIPPPIHYQTESFDYYEMKDRTHKEEDPFLNGTGLLLPSPSYGYVDTSKAFDNGG